MRWNSDDVIRFDIDESLVGEKCFNDENMPLRLWDRSHAIKNMGKKVFDISESYHMGHISYESSFPFSITLFLNHLK